MKIIPFLFAYVKILFYICTINNTKTYIMKKMTILKIAIVLTFAVSMYYIITDMI